MTINLCYRCGKRPCRTHFGMMGAVVYPTCHDCDMELLGRTKCESCGGSGKQPDTHEWAKPVTPDTMKELNG